MTLRHAVLIAHRWLGLTSSVVLSIVGVSGAVLLWPSPDLLLRIAGRLHETVALGRLGAWIVLFATVAAVVLHLGGLFLWWKTKTLAVRTGVGWRRTVIDLHHSVGVLGLILMFTLALSGVGMSLVKPRTAPQLRRVVIAAHTARSFPTSIKLLYTVASTAFLVQGVSGVAMWWSTRR